MLRILKIICFFSGFFLTVFTSYASAANSARGFTVQDSIALVRFSYPSEQSGDGKPLFSPDRKHLVIVTSRGLIDTNRTESTIWVYDAEKVLRFVDSKLSNRLAPHPRLIARLSAIPHIIATNSYASIISNLRWSLDSQYIYFLAEDSDEERSIYRADIRLATPIRLTGIGYDVQRFDFNNRALIYTAFRSQRPSGSKGQPTDHVEMDARDVTGLPLETILFHMEEKQPKRLELWRIKSGSGIRVDRDPSDAEHAELQHYQDVLSLSHDGRFAIRLEPVTDVPGSWVRYTPASGSEGLRIDSKDFRFTSPFNKFRLERYVLIHLDTGRAVPLLDGPNAFTLGYNDANQAVWSPDGRRLLLTNVFLAGDSKEGSEVRPCAVATVDFPSQFVRCIISTRALGSATEDYKPLRLEKATFGPTNDDVILSFGYHDLGKRTEHYHFGGDVWNEQQPSDVSAADSPGCAHRDADLSLEIKQDLNHPPTLWAIDERARKRKELWNPNRLIDELQLGAASIYHWRDDSGYRWTGGLILPIDYHVGKRYPLVIQTHGFLEDRFITDGAFPTALAARPLSTAGFVVLQIRPRIDHVDTPQEADDQVRGFAAAVAQLDAEGLIDPERVGAVGFSRTCWYVEMALVSDPHLFAAAIIADGVDFSYMQCMLFCDVSVPFQSEFAKVNGGIPIGGEHLSKWLALAVNFRLDGVTTPLRIEAIGPRSLLAEWEIYSSLKQQGKNVSLLYLPDGQHILQKPQERKASQQASIDWFVSWLHSDVTQSQH
jgi:hypothetical protein